MYVELYGDESQSNDYPAEVYLRLRHMSASYFRDGNDTIQEFRQPLGSMRKFEFNRFGITNTAECNNAMQEGNRMYNPYRLLLPATIMNFHLIVFLHNPKVAG